MDVQGQTFKAGPQPGRDTPYYYPGGRFQGRPVPAGWYSTPWWKTALGAGVGVVGGLSIADALFSPGWGDPGYGEGYQEGFADGGDQGGAGDVGGAGDQAGEVGGGDYGGGGFGDFGGGGDW